MGIFDDCPFEDVGINEFKAGIMISQISRQPLHPTIVVGKPSFQLFFQSELLKVWLVV